MPIFTSYDPGSYIKNSGLAIIRNQDFAFQLFELVTRKYLTFLLRVSKSNVEK